MATPPAYEGYTKSIECPVTTMLFPVRAQRDVRFFELTTSYFLQTNTSSQFLLAQRTHLHFISWLIATTGQDLILILSKSDMILRVAMNACFCFQTPTFRVKLDGSTQP